MNQSNHINNNESINFDFNKIEHDLESFFENADARIKDVRYGLAELYDLLHLPVETFAQSMAERSQLIQALQKAKDSISIASWKLMDIQKEGKKYQKDINKLLNAPLSETQKETLNTGLQNIKKILNTTDILRIDANSVKEKIEQKIVLVDLNRPLLESIGIGLLKFIGMLLFIITIGLMFS